MPPPGSMPRDHIAMRGEEVTLPMAFPLADPAAMLEEVQARLRRVEAMDAEITANEDLNQVWQTRIDLAKEQGRVDREANELKKESLEYDTKLNKKREEALSRARIAVEVARAQGHDIPAGLDLTTAEGTAAAISATKKEQVKMLPGQLLQGLEQMAQEKGGQAIPSALGELLGPVLGQRGAGALGGLLGGAVRALPVVGAVAGGAALISNVVHDIAREQQRFNQLTGGTSFAQGREYKSYQGMLAMDLGIDKEQAQQITQETLRRGYIGPEFYRASRFAVEQMKEQGMEAAESMALYDQTVAKGLDSVEGLSISLDGLRDVAATTGASLEGMRSVFVSLTGAQAAIGTPSAGQMPAMFAAGIGQIRALGGSEAAAAPQVGQFAFQALATQALGGQNVQDFYRLWHEAEGTKQFDVIHELAMETLTALGFAEGMSEDEIWAHPALRTANFALLQRGVIAQELPPAALVGYIHGHLSGALSSQSVLEGKAFNRMRPEKIRGRVPGMLASGVRDVPKELRDEYQGFMKDTGWRMRGFEQWGAKFGDMNLLAKGKRGGWTTMEKLAQSDPNFFWEQVRSGDLRFKRMPDEDWLGMSPNQRENAAKWRGTLEGMLGGAPLDELADAAGMQKVKLDLTPEAKRLVQEFQVPEASVIDAKSRRGEVSPGNRHPPGGGFFSGVG